MDNQTSDTRMKGLKLSFAIAACTAVLAACGGGGSGDSTPAPAPAPAPAPTPPVLVDPAVAMRGFWGGVVTSAPDGTTGASAVVMPDGIAWVVTESSGAPTAVARLTLTGTAVSETNATINGSGSYYRLSDGAKSALSASGTASTAGTFKGSVTVAGNAASAFDWTSAAGFSTQAQQADATGTWQGTAGTGAVTLSWSISAAGAVSGTSSTGCSYTGTVNPATGTAVYNMSVAEDCQGTVKNLSGIATLVSNKTALRTVFTAESGATAGLFSLTKR